VLGKFRDEEAATLRIVIENAADAVISALQSGLSAAMNRFNQSSSL
jgi:peptidyl-tRNA hydrolase